MTDWQSDPEYLALLETVLTNPEDDAPRGIISDWLEEHDQVRYARFIRAQLKLQQLIKSEILLKTSFHENAHIQNLNRKIDELWAPIPAKHGVRKLIDDSMHSFKKMVLLLDSLTGVSAERKALVHRGFVCEIALPCSEFMKNAEKLFRCHPITEVWLTDKQPFYDPVTPRFATHPYLWRIISPDAMNGPTSWLPTDIALKLPTQLYRTEESAIGALSRTCVEYGRELAGLPPLTNQ